MKGQQIYFGIKKLQLKLLGMRLIYDYYFNQRKPLLIGSQFLLNNKNYN